MSNDIKKVLKMVEEGTITAEEAETLIKAMNQDGGQNISEKRKGKRKKAIRVRIAQDGEQKININLPLSLIDIVAKIGTKFIPYDDIPNGEVLKELDWDEIVESIKEGTSGKIVDIQDGGDVVEVWVE